VHIFWQKRIRRGDVTTPWWFPSETSGGAVRENRIVLPIPPGTHWSDAKPIVLPNADCQLPIDGVKQLPTAGVTGPKKRVRKVKELVVVRPEAIVAGGLRFGTTVPGMVEEKVVKKEKRQTKNDPRLVAAARELKDRWLEQVNAGLYLPEAVGKYEVSRLVSEREGRAELRIERARETHLIEQAA
jgi:hypothetical protein